MKKELQKIRNTVIIVIVLFGLTFMFWNNPLIKWGFETKSFFLGLSISCFITLIIDLSLYDNITFLIKTQFTSRKEKVRITTAYLFRIKHNNKYLLIKNGNKYFPVGGKIKFYESAVTSWKHYKIDTLENDYLLKQTEKRKDDLVKVIQRNEIPLFIDWFKSRQDREVCLWREFYDELVFTNIFPQNIFPFIHCKFIASNPLKITYFQEKAELKLHELYELVLNEEQKKFIENLYNSPNDKIFWATEKEIKNLKSDNSEIEFADHTHFILLN